MKEEKEREERERRAKEREGGNLITRLWKHKPDSSQSTPPVPEPHETVDLYVASDCGLRVEGKKRQALPRSGDRNGRGDIRYPRTLLGLKDPPLMAMREMMEGGDVGGQASPVKLMLSHQRSHSSHPILLSTGPPLSSLPVQLNPPTRPSAGNLRPPPTRQEVLDAMARSSSNPPPFSVGPSSTHTRTRSPSRSSRSEVGDLKFHPEPTPSTPTPAITTPVMIPPVIPPSLLNTSASSPVSPTSLRKSPPPLPTKPIVRPTLAYPSGPSPPIPQMSPNPPSLSVPPPLPVRVPSPTRPHPPPIAFTIQPQFSPSRSRSVSRSSLSRPYHTPMGLGEVDAGTPSPQPVSPVSPRVAGMSEGGVGGGRVGMRTRPLPSVPRTRPRSVSAKRKENEAKTVEEKERREEVGGVIMRAI